MEIRNNRIPGVRIENTGSKAKPRNVIKGVITLPCWNGHYLYEAADKLKAVKVVTDGLIGLSVDYTTEADGNFYVADEQVNAYFALVANQQNIRQSILNQLKQEFPQLLSGVYSSWDHDAAFFPRLTDLTPEFDFRNYIGPESITIRKDIKDGEAYIIWHFRCFWDIEHELEVITHKEKVIEIAPEADPWKIFKDNDTYEQKEKAYNDKMSTFTFPVQKKWWQFWKV